MFPTKAVMMKLRRLQSASAENTFRAMLLAEGRV
jgi:hypothetical protein